MAVEEEIGNAINKDNDLEFMNQTMSFRSRESTRD